MRPLTGLGSTSSGRSIVVGASVSAARRVCTSTSATLMPGNVRAGCGGQGQPHTGPVVGSVAGAVTEELRAIQSGDEAASRKSGHGEGSPETWTLLLGILLAPRHG